MWAANGLEALGGAVNRALGFLFVTLLKPLRLLVRFTVFLCKKTAGLFTRSGEGDRLFSGKFSRGVSALFSALKKDPKRFWKLLRRYAVKAFRRYRRPIRRGLVACALLALIAFGAAALSVRLSMPAALCISAEGRVLGYVSAQSDYEGARAEAEKTLSLGAGDGGALLPAVTLSVRRVHADALMDKNELYNALLQASRAELADACGIYIDGEFLCAVKSETRARAVFGEALDRMAPQAEGVRSFVQELAYVQGLYPAAPEIIWSPEQLRARLAAGDLLTLRTVTTQVVTEITDYETVEVLSDMLYIGKTREVSAGRTGVAQITYLVTYEENAPVNTQEISRITVREPVAKTVQVGTRALDAAYIPGYDLGGVLLWPVIGADRINSDYAYRWGKLHAALDIGSSSGTSLGKTVIAAAEGTVVISGVHSSYGYYVKIDHGNGMQTLYAHCMAGSLMVGVGQHVYAGQPIARVGQTGYATGPHLHFEVIINGSRVDPKPYLGISY